MKQSVDRLIRSFKPSNYVLSIDQDSDKMIFSGTVEISGTLTSKTDSITLHSDGLELTNTTINELPAVVTYSPDEQTVTIQTQIVCDDIVIKTDFNGVITKPMHGLYPCFFDHDGVEKRLLATQFESHHAREAFPCIDEPEAKAVFQLNLTTNDTDVAISNMPISKEGISGTRKTTTFEETPIMSTYLLAWVSGDLEYQQSITGNGIQVRAYCTPVHSGKTAFSLEVACKALDYMDEYFGTPYPLKKCDIIALPDFAAGAMENWGCITFRESAMLIDADQSDLGDKQHVANVVTHELAHQWFGNLVTMRWWDDLWLNEGFASWIPYLVLNDIFPQWRLWEQFSTGDLMIGLRADALENTHPIVVEIHSPNEIRSAFDSISYDKGCSVINLLFRYIGPESFRDGLRAYLSEHAYGNAETADLWRAWAKSSGKDVEGFMSSWTTKKGFPIIQATTTKDGLQLSQERFFLNHSDGTDQTLWPIPLIQGDGDHTIFDTKTAEISSTKKLNSGQSGFYRVIYDKAAIESILSAKPSPIDMLGLINDASEAAKAGYHSTTEALDLIRTVSTSENEPLMGTSLGELASIRTVLSSTFDAMKPFVGTFIQSNYKRLGIEKKKHDTVDDELLRPMILGAASYSGYDAVVLWALETFAEAKTPEDILPDMRAVVYHTAVRERGNSKTYEKLLAWYNANTIPGEQVNIANALTSFKDEDHIKRTLTYITTENVKLQDSLYWIAYSLVGRHSKHLAWKWLQQNWEWIGENFGKEKEIDYYLRYAANGFATVKHLKEYEEFFSSVDIYGSKRAFEQGRETIAWQTAWRSRDEQSVVDWLKHA